MDEHKALVVIWKCNGLNLTMMFVVQSWVQKKVVGCMFFEFLEDKIVVE